MHNTPPDMAGDVKAFRLAMGQECPERPIAATWGSFHENPNIEAARSFVREEIREWREAHAMREEVDALVDLVYVSLGLLWALGVDPAPVWRLVHNANMAKLGGPKSPEGKQLKPPGWTHPNIAAELDRQRKEGHEQ